MTKQELYDRVYTALVQGKLPAIDGDTCSYRTKDGRACIVGLVMPDTVYEQNFESLPIVELPQEVREMCTPEGMRTEEMFALQSIHDSLGLRVEHKQMDKEQFLEVFLEVFNGFFQMHADVKKKSVNVFQYDHKLYKETASASQG